MKSFKLYYEFFINWFTNINLTNFSLTTFFLTMTKRKNESTKKSAINPFTVWIDQLERSICLLQNSHGTRTLSSDVRSSLIDETTRQTIYRIWKINYCISVDFINCFTRSIEYDHINFTCSTINNNIYLFRKLFLSFAFFSSLFVISLCYQYYF